MVPILTTMFPIVFRARGRAWVAKVARVRAVDAGFVTVLGISRFDPANDATEGIEAHGYEWFCVMVKLSSVEMRLDPKVVAFSYVLCQSRTTPLRMSLLIHSMCIPQHRLSRKVECALCSKYNNVPGRITTYLDVQHCACQSHQFLSHNVRNGIFV